MNRMTRMCLRVGGAAVSLSVMTATASAVPTNVTLTPPAGARFLEGQRFDIRLEGKGAGPFSATLSLDGTPVDFTSGEQNTTTTDGISAPGYGGFNVRGHHDECEGEHQLRATLTDATGTVSVSARYTIVKPWGRRRPMKNVIIMLGDGMGIAHRTAARIVRYGVHAGDPGGFLAMDGFPGTGFVTTHSLNSIITDSAPGMSGYVTGNHQNNNQEGVWPANVVNPFYAPRVEYLSEYFHRTQGKALGLVSTADLEDATPAANAVHTLLRGNGTGIIDQYLAEADADETGDHGSGLRVLLGGGRRWFLPAGEFGSSRAAANDYERLPADLLAGWRLPLAAAGALDPGRDTLAAWKAAGFHYVEDAAQLDAVRADGGRRAPRKLLGLFAYGNMNVALDKLAKRRGVPLAGASGYLVDDYHAPNQPMLDEMTDAALGVLGKSRRGFLLMVEGAHIDKQSHAMDPERAINDTLEFDRAIALARSFAERDGETLVLVLSDHECSGFSVIGALSGGMAALAALPSDAATLDPTAVPQRQKVVGTYDAAGFPAYEILPDGYPRTMDIDGKLLIGYGASGDRFETWQTTPTTIIDSLIPSDIRGELVAKGYGVEPADRNEKKNGFFLRGQAVGHTQAVHTAADIPVSAFSVNRGVYRQFVGIQKNTDVFFKISRALGGGY